MPTKSILRCWKKKNYRSAYIMRQEGETVIFSYRTHKLHVITWLVQVGGRVCTSFGAINSRIQFPGTASFENYPQHFQSTFYETP